MTRRWVVTLLVFVGAAAPAVAQTKLEWKFKKADTFYQQTVTNTDQKRQIGDQEDSLEMTQTVVSKWTVLDVADGKVVLEQTIEEVSAANKGGGNVAAGLAQIKGATFKITLVPKEKDGTYRVERFEGYEEMMKRIAGEEPVAAKTIRSVLSEETLRKAVEEMFDFLNREPVAVDKSWDRTQSIPLGPLGTIKATNTYTYKGAENQLEKIAVSAKLEYTKPAEAPGAPFKISQGELTTENGTGQVLFDNKLGRLHSTSLQLKLQGTFKIEVPGGRSQEIKISQIQNVTVTISKEKPISDKKP